MKRLILAAIALLVFASPIHAGGWKIQLAVNPGYIAQEVEDEFGEKDTDFNPIVSTGIELFRVPALGRIGFGFSLNAATVVDEGQESPSIIPCGMVHVGSETAQFYGGACHLTRHGGENDIAATFGFTAAF